jgi:NodT family efflux transporter outer membrane factor (OMF) lipoprotein
MRAIRFIASLLALPIPLLASCAARPEPTPTLELPSAWIAADRSSAANVTRQWFREFGSEELNSLVAEAYQAGLDLRAADARVRQADARARAAGGAILPQLDFNANSTTYSGHSANGSAKETDYAALVSASYEVDFWGKNRAAVVSAEALRQATVADAAVVELTTLTGVANTYFLVVSLREEGGLAKATLENARSVLDVVAARRGVGLATPVEVAQQRAAVAGAAIRIRELEQQETQEQAALAVLLGKLPGTLHIEAVNLSGFKEPRVSAGLPADVLTRRPDVYAAEEALRAAHADLVQARAALLPSITLTGSGGIQNPALQAAVLTLSGVGPSLTAGAALAQAVFDGGRLRAARDEAAAKETEHLVNYRAAVLAALWDTEIALSAIDRLDLQEKSQQESLAQGEAAFAGAQARYREGLGDFVSVLEGERTLFLARAQMSQYRLARLQAQVGLCKALGGGWLQKN